MENLALGHVSDIVHVCVTVRYIKEFKNSLVTYVAYYRQCQ